MTLALFSVGRTCRLVHGDSEFVLPTLADGSIDAVVTDPPSGIGFMGKEWDRDRGGRDQWVAWLAGILRECLRVLKPGGHALIWALPRTTHWTAMAIEDAGFELRDRIAHLFGQGFPKSHDVSKAIDEHLGVERIVLGAHPNPASASAMDNAVAMGLAGSQPPSLTAPGSPEAEQWDGWGTGLKPACEDWWLARKPLVGTVAANVLAHGVGAINVDACRLSSEGNKTFAARFAGDRDRENYRTGTASGSRPSGVGRWPANVTLNEEAARMLDKQSGTLTDGVAVKRRGRDRTTPGWGNIGIAVPGTPDHGYGGAGGASRFFYVAKAASDEKSEGGRVDNEHPTVKSVALMRWLVRLITPPGGVVLDAFAGSGTTGVACAAEGFSFIGIEQDKKEHATALARLRCSFGEVAT